LAELDNALAQLADGVIGVPCNPLMMRSPMIDGITRHSPEGNWLKELVAREDSCIAVQWRESGRDVPRGEAVEDEVNVGAKALKLRLGAACRAPRIHCASGSQMLHAMDPKVFARVAERKNGVI